MPTGIWVHRGTSCGNSQAPQKGNGRKTSRGRRNLNSSPSPQDPAKSMSFFHVSDEETEARGGQIILPPSDGAGMGIFLPRGWGGG